jgi:hypothetical protein
MNKGMFMSHRKETKSSGGGFDKKSFCCRAGIMLARVQAVIKAKDENRMQ